MPAGWNIRHDFRLRESLKRCGSDKERAITWSQLHRRISISRGRNQEAGTDVSFPCTAAGPIFTRPAGNAAARCCGALPFVSGSRMSLPTLASGGDPAFGPRFPLMAPSLSLPIPDLHVPWWPRET